jgi:hypothetical protein
VSLSAPAANAQVSGSAVTISANASDSSNGSGVQRVEFLINGNVIATRTASPYSTTFSSLLYPNGNHTLMARAFDQAGNSAQSAPLTIQVVNSVVDPGPMPKFQFEGGLLLNPILPLGRGRNLFGSITQAEKVLRLEYWVGGKRVCGSVPVGSGCLVTSLLAGRPYRIEVRVIGLNGSTLSSEIVDVVSEGSSE